MLDFVAHSFSADIAEVDAHLVDGLADFFTSSGASSGALAGMMSAFYMIRVSSLMALLSSDEAAPPSKKLFALTFCRLSGSPGVFLSEVLPCKEERDASFQDTGINTGIGQDGLLSSASFRLVVIIMGPRLR